MAYNAQLISPLDFQPSVGVGVGLPFNGKSCFNITYTTQDALKSNLVNWFLTNKGERPLNPDFGGNLRQFLFEQITDSTADDLDLLIRSGVERYFPNVVITQLIFGGNPNDNILTVNLSYTIKNTRESDNITLSIDG